MVKAVCFDLDGVYFTGEGKKSFHQALVRLAGDEDKVIHILYKSVEMLSFVTGGISEPDFWEFCRNYLGIKSSDAELRKLWGAGYEIDTEVRETVLAVREQGILACLCSNNNPARVSVLQEKFNFLSDFDVTIFSYQVGAVKPSKEIFQALIDECGVEPGEIVYSDDNPDRLQGARDLGINTFLFEDFDQFTAELKKLGVQI